MTPANRGRLVLLESPLLCAPSFPCFVVSSSAAYFRACITRCERSGSGAARSTLNRHVYIWAGQGLPRCSSTKQRGLCAGSAILALSRSGSPPSLVWAAGNGPPPLRTNRVRDGANPDRVKLLGIPLCTLLIVAWRRGPGKAGARNALFVGNACARGIGP